MSNQKSAIINQSFAFAVEIVNLCKQLSKNKKEFVLSRQLLRSGTAVGALAREAQNAESKADFIHKLAIAQKECAESIYWLELLLATEYIESEVFNLLNEKANSILKMIRSAIITTKSNL